MSLRLANALFPPVQNESRKDAIEFFQPDLYHKTVVNGKRLYNILVGLDAPIKTSSPTKLVEWYNLTRGCKPLRTKPGLAKELQAWNISDLDFEFIEVMSKGAEDAAYVNWCNSRQKCIISLANFKALDINPTNERLFPLEALWQSWLLAGQQFPNFEPSSLQMMVRSWILNPSARRAIWYAARRSTSLYNDLSTGRAVYTKDDEGFYAILGSDNRASSIRLLIDHKYELGGRVVDKIVVVGGEHDISDDFTRSRAFILILSERAVTV